VISYDASEVGRRARLPCSTSGDPIGAVPCHQHRRRGKAGYRPWATHEDICCPLSADLHYRAPRVLLTTPNILLWALIRKPAWVPVILLVDLVAECRDWLFADSAHGMDGVSLPLELRWATSVGACLTAESMFAVTASASFIETFLEVEMIGDATAGSRRGGSQE